jgi:acyl-CoA thioesterase II
MAKSEMSPFELEMVLETHPDSTQVSSFTYIFSGKNRPLNSAQGKEKYIKIGPHWAPPRRPIMGSILLAQALTAAYKTIPAPFQIHHLTAQFFLPGHAKLQIEFEVITTNDGKNNMGRLVNVCQKGKLIMIVTMSFMRSPRLDGLSLFYGPPMPKVDPPDEKIDDLKSVSKGIAFVQSLDRVLSSSPPPRRLPSWG